MYFQQLGWASHTLFCQACIRSWFSFWRGEEGNTQLSPAMEPAVTRSLPEAAFRPSRSHRQPGHSCRAAAIDSLWESAWSEMVSARRVF